MSNKALKYITDKKTLMNRSLFNKHLIQWKSFRCEPRILGMPNYVCLCFHSKLKYDLFFFTYFTLKLNEISH